MSIWQPGDEDTLNFEWNEHPEDPRNIFFTLDEENPSEALRIKIGNSTGILGADEVFILLDWLQEREWILHELVQRQPTVLPDQDTEAAEAEGKQLL